MIVKNIERLCKAREVSISALEKRLGFGNSTISKWSRCSPTVEKLALVANFFDTTVDALLAEEHEG